MSKLVNKTRLQQFATKLWDKIKERYDVAFKNATISPSEGNEKHITFERISGQTPLKVSLQDYARLQDRNEFKKDVSVDNVGVANNSHIGNDKGIASDNRSLGFRQLTTSAFVDGYVDHVKIYVDSANTNTNSTWTVWAVTKGANGKENDRVAKVVCSSKVLAVNSVTEGTETKKFVKIPVESSFEHETYFIAKCTTHKLEVASNIKQEYANDVINMNGSQPPMTPGAAIDWNGGGNTSANTAIMHLIGRESIGSLAEKLKQTQADSSLYVKHSECTVQGGSASANGKVVKLGANGKLDDSILPAIALNEFFTATAPTWNEQAVANLTFQNGDVIFHQASQKRYLCINKEAADFANRFVELNSKDGVVTSINNETGVVNLSIEESVAAIKIKANNTVVGTINAITEDEINTIIQNLS